MTNSTVSNINASGTAGTGYGIYLVNTSGNQIVGNTVHGRCNGIVVRNSGHDTISHNDLTDNDYGIQDWYNKNVTEGNVYTDNDVSRSAVHALILVNEDNAIVARNVIVDSGNIGLALHGSSSARVYHNNIYGNGGQQVFAGSPIELSHLARGNFWGRVCDDLLFLAGVDSNSADVIDR